MVTITGNKFLVRTSVSVLAMVLSASMALAEGEEITAGTEVETTEITPEIVVCEMYPGAVFVNPEFPGPEDILVEVEDVEVKNDDPDGDLQVTSMPEDGGEELSEPHVDPVLGENGGETPVYYSTSGINPDMVKRDIVLTTPVAARESQSRDPAAVPNLCDIAGPGLDWLCGAKVR